MLPGNRQGHRNRANTQRGRTACRKRRQRPAGRKSRIDTRGFSFHPGSIPGPPFSPSLFTPPQVFLNECDIVHRGSAPAAVLHDRDFRKGAFGDFIRISNAGVKDGVLRAGPQPRFALLLCVGADKAGNQAPGQGASAGSGRPVCPRSVLSVLPARQRRTCQSLLE